MKSQKEIKKIGVFTSGGDAPGMNAAIRAVVRTAIQYNLEVIGIKNGYRGLYEKNFVNLNQRSVANIIQRGGTFLKSGRFPEFKTPDVRTTVAQNIKDQGINAVVCIGGDGSLTGVQALWNEHQIPFAGIPGTIDNDIFGTDNTIGFDTAINTALEAIDRIRDTAASHDRLFIVEVMGHSSGFIASSVGLAGGAEAIFIPENPFNIEKVVHKIQESQKKGKTSSILVAAEGQKPGRAYDLAENIRKHSGLSAKVCILGHIQRGGSPTATDRILASRMGAAAVESLLKGNANKYIGIIGSQLQVVDTPVVLNQKKYVDQQIITLADVLSL